MTKPKIIIIGGGIGGLSCATSLAETGEFDISIYESDIIGGQASTQKSALCNTEISWRVFLGFYDNLFQIINTIGARDNFYNLTDGNVCINNENSENIIVSTLKQHSWSQLSQIFKLLILDKDRAINDYHHVKACDVLDSDIMKIVIGPYYGLEPSKVTLSTFYKFTYNYFQSNNPTEISRYPTSDSLFNPWRKYLELKNVKIYEHHALENVVTNKEGKIEELIIKNKSYKANEIVLASSLKPIVDIFNNNVHLAKSEVGYKLNKIISGQQFYISVNFYWKKTVIPNMKCHIYTFTNGWVPIIIKRFINNDYVEKHCHPEIKEVWNIGLADYLVGNYVKKYTSQSSFEEIVYEIKMNLIHSEHFQKYFDFENYSYEDYFYDYEFDERYYQKLPSTEKFSINQGIEENLMHSHEPSLGNVYFSSYFTKNSVGGASMETSCEIGLNAAKEICNKYQIENFRSPIYKKRDHIYKIFYPLILLDGFLYRNNQKPIFDYIDCFTFILFYLIILFVIALGIVYYLCKSIMPIKKIKFKKLFKPLKN